MKKAMTKLKMSLTNNIGMKIIAVLVAAIVWLAVINVNDPEKTITIYNVPITMTNEEAITDMGMVYNLESKSSVNITISGKRSVVGNLTADDFLATASFTELSKVNAIPVEISTKQKAVGRKVTIVKQSIQTVTVSVENIEKQEFNVEVEFNGKTAEGYVTGSYSLSKNVVSIEAPTSILDRIDSVVAECDLSGSSSDIEQSCDLILYDKRGKVIKTDKAKLSNKKVKVYVDVLKQKEVPVNISSVGNPADGYRVAEVTLSQEKVKLVGAAAALKEIKSLDIGEEINITGQKKDITTTIDLKKYLPDGVSVLGSSEIQITIKIDKLATKTYTIKEEDINVENLKDGLALSISGKSIKVTLQGEKAVMEKISADDIRASIDLKGYDTGTAKVPVSIVIPDQTELMKKVTVKVKLSLKEENK